MISFINYILVGGLLGFFLPAIIGILYWNYLRSRGKDYSGLSALPLVCMFFTMPTGIFIGIITWIFVA